jgi:hypothetical protein
MVVAVVGGEMNATDKNVAIPFRTSHVVVGLYQGVTKETRLVDTEVIQGPIHGRTICQHGV